MVLVAPGISFQVFEPEVFSCHCTVGLGVPLAAAVNVAVLPEFTVWPVGCVVTTGSVFTVRVAGLVVTVPAMFVNTAWYCLPVSPAAVVKL